jgi:hypothetical protein
MKENEVVSDNDIRHTMCESKTVHEWNERREDVKEIRSIPWISRNLDQSGLIKTLDLAPSIVLPVKSTVDTTKQSQEMKAMNRLKFKKEVALEMEDIYEWYLTSNHMRLLYKF